jgi:hypothetical protein
MKKIILIVEEKHYKINNTKVGEVFAGGNTKWLKVFKSVGRLMNAKMYSYRPHTYPNNVKHDVDISILNEKTILEHKFDLVYVHKQESLKTFNRLNIKYDSSLLFAENTRIKYPIDKINAIAHCSINEFLNNPIHGKINIMTPNICNGSRLSLDMISEKRNNKVAFIGRLSNKHTYSIINLLANNFKDIQFDIYGSKFLSKEKGYIGLGPHCIDRKDAHKQLRELLPGKNIVFKNILAHKDLYMKLNEEKYLAGLAPSIHSFGYNIPQMNSSSKFYDYIGAGIPVFIEDIVPEAYYVKKNPNIGTIYSTQNKKDIIDSFERFINYQNKYFEIVKYANKNHYEESRAAEIVSRVK